MSTATDPGQEPRLFDEDPFRDGFNIKTIIGALFVGLIMLPGAVYMGLVSGMSVGAAAQWVTIILFVEIAKRSFVKMSRQEIIILYGVTAGLIAIGAKLGSAVAIFGGPFGSLVWDQYLVQSPQAEQFGVAHMIPRWFSPRAGSDALVNRTFLHRDWLVPISILGFHLVMSKVVQLSGGYFFYRVCNDIEKLPYPMAPVNAGAATALAETSSKQETWRWRIFSLGAMIGIGWGALYVILPVITGAVLTKPIMILPIPFWDLTDKIGTLLPAGAFGLRTQLALVFTGFVLPFWVVVGSFISSCAIDLFLNPVVFHNWLGILRTWQPGMNVISTRMANTVDLYLSVGIGLGGVIAVVGLVGVTKTLIRRALSLDRGKGAAAIDAGLAQRGDLPIALVGGIWGVAMVSYVFLVHLLVPTFSVLLLLFFALIWSPLISYISARMMGITGSTQGVAIPFIREGSFILSGYRGVAIWFAPVPLFNVGRGSQSFKQLELTRTKFVSTVKAQFAVIIILFICSFIYWSVIWRMAPIPSSAYPFVTKMWPLSAFSQCLWVSSTVGEGKNWLLSALRLKYVLSASAVGFVLYGITRLFGMPIPLFYGLVGGASMWIHQSIVMFAGALLGRYYFARKIGARKWRAYTPVLLAGFGCGLGLVMVSSVGVALIAKAISTVVF